MGLSPIRALHSVLLPQPEAPTTPRLSPLCSSKLMPSTAFSQRGAQGIPPMACQQRIASTRSTGMPAGRSGVRPPSRSRAEASRRWPRADRGAVSS